MARKQEKFDKKIWEYSPIWNVLTDEEKTFIDENARIYNFKKNDIIQHEGDTPTDTMMLINGTARACKRGVNSRPQIIRLLQPYDLFSYRGIIADQPYNTTVSAREDCSVFMVKKEAFLRVIQSNSQFCYLYFVQMAKDLGVSDTRTVTLTQKHIRGRLAESLIGLKDKYGLDEDEATISIYLSREDLANLSNMTTANAIRTLASFAEEGIVSLDGKKIKILDFDQLIRISRLG